MDTNPKYSGDEGIRATESRGIEMNASTSNDMVDYWYLGSAKYWELIFDFITAPLLKRTFRKKVFEREKHAVIEELKNHQDDKLRRYKDVMSKTVYPRSSISASIAEILKSTEKCTIADLAKFFKQNYSPTNTTLLVVGKFPINKLIAQIKKLEKFKQGCDGYVGCPHITTSAVPKEIFVKSPKVSKTYATLIFKLDITPYSKEYYTSKVLTYCLTDGFLSLLYKILRIEKKWIYSMHSFLSITCYDSDFSIKFNTDSKNFNGCVREIFKTLGHLKKTVDSATYKMAMAKISKDRDEMVTGNQVARLSMHYQDLIVAGAPTSAPFITLDKYYANLLAVKPNEIKKFVAKNLNRSNCWLFYGSDKKPMLN